MKVLCWAGPEHGHTVDTPLTAGPTMRFPQPTRFAGMRLDEEVNPTMSMSTVTYNRERLAWKGRNGSVWPVLVYAENADYHMRGLIAAANLMAWLAGGWMFAETTL